MKILTIAGTRPELIRLSVLIKKLDSIVNHIFVYTNQNYDKNLSNIFFDELGIRDPDYIFEYQDGFSNFMANAFVEFAKILDVEKPDKILILGDTNSGLLSIVANKYGIPVVHMEAGNRCFNGLVPEETNRKIIDNVSKFNLPYTENSKQNLLTEGFHKNYIFKTGNPIYEVLNFYEKEWKSSDVLNMLDLKEQEFVLVTAHRSENVDNFKSLSNIMKAINIISRQFKVVVSLHPRTKDKLKKFDIYVEDNVFMMEPFGFFDFIKLERGAKIVISDSGTCQEECCIFNIPSITIRDSTERQETIECGSNILSGTDKNQIVNTFNVLINRKYRWSPPNDYVIENVSDIVINILLGK